MLREELRKAREAQKDSTYEMSESETEEDKKNAPLPAPGAASTPVNLRQAKNLAKNIRMRGILSSRLVLQIGKVSMNW